MAEYSTATSYRASASYYTKPTERFGLSIAAGYAHNGGFFRNTYRDEMCDKGDNASARLRMQWVLNERWSLDNILSAGYTNEGGYAYHPYDPTLGSCGAIAYNDPSGYERLTINEGLVAKYRGDKINLTSVTSYGYLNDKMTLDQDFSPKSMFTMQQLQREHSITEDIVIRNASNSSRWQWLSGAFLFAKWLDMSSPVTFKESGIDELILGNINNGLHTVFPNNNMMFGCNNFVINSDFSIPTYGAALYHQSTWDLGRWHLTAGIRFDFEQTSMRYNSNTSLPYRFDLTMSDFAELYTEFKGRERQTFFEVLPKIAVRYDLEIGNIFATITRGYKSGGFNTQIFSDILQVKMMNDMMDALGIELDSAAGATTYDSASATRYKPETSWNFEVGTHLSPAEGLTLDGSLFWIECFNQQVTVLPKGNSTGRMMSNAARARSYGVELSANYNYRGFSATLDYGYTNAKFRKYNDGTADYSGNYLPYAPQNTINIMAGYTWSVDNEKLRNITLSADWQGIGRIYWNESNSLSQPLYSLLGAQLSLRFNKATLTLWGRNLLNSDYNVFYFKSVGKEFFSKGAPIHAGIRLNINL
jgi:outer membrane receptor protein involved in Fe transport